MVNASLNWASIVGIVLAVSGAGLYFMRSFKPALARDYDVFFAAIGLLCGGILFFQGWRLDPILQFGQFLLAGTTVFFAYESVRLRGVTTDQARRSSYFDDEASPPGMPGKERWDEENSYGGYERFDGPSPSPRRRFQSSSADADEQDFYRTRRSPRAAIPEEAASRRIRSSGDQGEWNEQNERSRRMSRFERNNDDVEIDRRANFGERRNIRQDQRQGSRPSANPQTKGRFSRESNTSRASERDIAKPRRNEIPQGSPMRPSAEDAAFSASKQTSSRPTRIAKPSSNSRESSTAYSKSPKRDQTRRIQRPRDNSSRFDD